MMGHTKNRDRRHRPDGKKSRGFSQSLASGALALAAGLSLLALSTAASAAVSNRDRAEFIHNRLTGTQASAQMLDLMEAAIAGGDPKKAARLAIDGNEAQGDAYGFETQKQTPPFYPSGGFYNAVLKNWVSPWTNEEQDVFKELNDFSATIIGMVRDAESFNTVLSANIIYTGANVANFTSTSSTTYKDIEAAYKQLEASSAPLGDKNVLVKRVQSDVTGIPDSGVAGVMTTRAAARAYFIDGTNRAMFRFTVLNFLCNDLEQYKDTELPTDRIRQDVSRSPGGDSSIFLNKCSGCHTGMDGMTSAFAYYDYDYPEGDEEAGKLVYTPGIVQEKYHINSGNFRDGFFTTNEHWINYWRTGPNSKKIGWRINPPTRPASSESWNPLYSEGDGAASLGSELANTDAFASCMVKKAFKTVCLREPQQTDDQAAFDAAIQQFENTYDMKQVFIDVAVHCSTTIKQ